MCTQLDRLNSEFGVGTGPLPVYGTLHPCTICSLVSACLTGASACTVAFLALCFVSHERESEFSWIECLWGLDSVLLLLLVLCWGSCMLHTTALLTGLLSGC